MSFTLASSVASYPDLPYATIGTAILGRSYQLSLSFVGQTRASQLNQTYRKKTYVPNVLSFPLDEDTGEIYICPAVARTEAPKHHLSYEQYVQYLFIHGCLHLKGYDHGDTMERQEQRYMRRFNDLAS